MSEVPVKEWILPEILNVLRENHQTLYSMGVRKLGLFGSYVRGEQKPSSDMDFVVDLASLTFDDYMDTKLFLEALFGRNVDLVIEKDIKPRLRPYIMREVRTILEQDDASDEITE